MSYHSETLEIAGERGWWPLSSNFLHSSLLPGHWESMEKGAARTGRTVSRGNWRIAREVHVAEDSRQAKEEALNGPMADSFERWFRPMHQLVAGNYDQIKVDPETPDEAINPQYMLDNFWIVGDPDECAQQLRRLYRDVGGFGTLLIICRDWGRDQKKWYRSLELMAKEVLPALQDLSPPLERRAPIGSGDLRVFSHLKGQRSLNDITVRRLRKVRVHCYLSRIAMQALR